MKVYIGPYPSRLTSKFHTRYMDKKYNFEWPNEQSKFENFLEKLESFIQTLYIPINYFLDKKQQKIKVRIDGYDTWSMDHTLAYIILPMLKQLKETKHGAPFVEMEDRPTHLQCLIDKESHDVDPYHFEAWDWVMDEMIYSFDCKANKDDVFMRFDNKIEMMAEQDRISNGFRLFGKYFEGLWD